MTRSRSRLASTSLAAAALLGSTQFATPAQASPQPAAPVASSSPELTNLDLVPAGGTVSVGGRSLRVVASLPVTHRNFTMAAITWQATTGSPVFQVRARGAAGWGEWRTLEAEPDGVSETERHGQRQGTEPTFLDASTAVEARVLASGPAATTVTAPRLALVDTRAQETDAGLAATARQQAPASRTVSAAAGSTVTYATRPAVVTRAQWGANEALLSWNGSGCVKATYDTTIKAAIVHNTAGTNNYTAAQSASIVRGIYAFHVQDRGWCDIGYNFLVDKYGTIFEGRHGGVDEVVHGAHATSWNTDTVGVSVMMDSNTAVQTPASMKAVSDVLAWKLAGNYRDPMAKLTLAGTYINRIAGHRDVMDTDCPGTNMYAYLPTLRQQVAAAMGNWRTPIYQAWQAQGGETGILGSPHVLERPWNGGRTTTFTGGAIYQTPTGATRWMSGAIRDRYTAAGFASLGWPTSDQTSPAPGVSKVTFEKGSITWSTSTGAHATSTAVDAWLASHPADATRLGLPTTEATGSATTGSQTFQNGRLTWDQNGFTAVLGSGRQGDLDGDGRADLLTVAANGAVTWYPTRADQTSGPATAGGTLAGAPYTWVSQVPDVNGDGHTELLARRADGTLWSWWGTGRGQFVGMRQVGHGWNGMRQMNVAPDMNGDRLPEIIAISPEQNLVRYQLGADLGVVRTQQIGQRWGAVVHMTSVGDFRRVGTTDILGVTADGLLWDFKGTTGGGVQDGVRVGHGWTGFTQVRSLGDLDGDGHWDLVGNRPNGPLYGYRSMKGSFGDRTALLAEVAGKGLLA